MRFGINLRGDLAKLDDVEIASKYEMLISETESMIQTLRPTVRNKWIYRLGAGLIVGRGLLHARFFYKLYVIAFHTFRLLNGGESNGIRKSIECYFLDCELKDTRDEIKRRVRRRKLVATS